jgi:hypothetical protein
MLKIRLTLLVLFGLLLLGNIIHAQDQQFPLEFDNARYNFGTIKEEGGIVSTRFFFRNVSDETINISGVFVSCGCTSPEWTERVLKQNDTASISISYNPMDRPEKFEKYIRIEFKESHKPQFVVIQGDVTPRPKGVRDCFPFRLGNLWFKKTNIFVGTVKKGKVQLVENRIYNNSEKAITIDFKKSTFPKFIKPTSSKITINSKDSVSFQLDYFSKKNKDWGFVTDSILLMTSDLESPTKKIEVGVILREEFKGNTEKQPKISVDSGNYNFGTIRKDSTLEIHFTINNLGSKKLKIRKLTSNCDCIEFGEISSKIAKNKEKMLVVKLQPDRLGFFSKRIIIISNDPKNNNLRLELEGEIIK